MYNAIVYRYDHVSADLALRPILAVETRLLDLFTEDQRDVIARKAQKLDKGPLRLDVSLELPGSASNDHEIGQLVLQNSKPETPFQIIQRTVFDTKYARAACHGFRKKRNQFSPGRISVLLLTDVNNG